MTAYPSIVSREFSVCVARNGFVGSHSGWRDGRVAEGGGLLNRCTVKSRTGGSNPPLSAILTFRDLQWQGETPRNFRRRSQSSFERVRAPGMTAGTASPPAVAKVLESNQPASHPAVTRK